jgi:hypothetical protein
MIGDASPELVGQDLHTMPPHCFSDLLRSSDARTSSLVAIRSQ